MKLDASALRYLTREDFRILSVLEIGSKNHEVVPLSMISSLTRMRPGAVNSRLSELARLKLVSKEHHTSYEGFRLTYGGYDYLALHTLSLRGTVEGIGIQIGVGKESDVYSVFGRYPESLPETPLESFIIKIERLGRTSFRTVKTNRDYLGQRKHSSWMFISRLAAEKEWGFLNALYGAGFPTPKPIDWNRHCIVMEHIDGVPLDRLHSEDWPESVQLVEIAKFLFDHLMGLLLKISENGLIHGDFNEFNLMVKNNFIKNPNFDHPSPIVMIDFPQMVSIWHPNAREFFDRDVECLRLFFSRRFGYEPLEWPDLKRDLKDVFENQNAPLLDLKLKAPGYKNRNGSVTDQGSSESASESELESESGSGSELGSESDSSPNCCNLDEE